MRIKQPEIIYEDEAIIVCRKEAGVAVQTARAGQAGCGKSVKELSCKKEGRTVYRADPSPGSTGGGRDGVCENAAGDSKTVCAGQQSQHGKRISGGDNRCAGATKRRTSGLAAADGKTNTSAVVARGTSQAKEAVLDYEVEQVLEDGQQALVHIWLHTGRHHQIRVQFAHAGYPLVGDTKYGKPEQGGRYCPVALCSCRIGFLHPVTKKKMEFVIEPKGKAFSGVAKDTKNV